MNDDTDADGDELEEAAGWAGPGGGMYLARGPRLIYTDGRSRCWQVIGTPMAECVAREHAMSQLIGRHPRADVIGARRACSASSLSGMRPSSALGVEVALRVRRAARAGRLRPAWASAARALANTWLECAPGDRVERVLGAIGAHAYWFVVGLLVDEYDRRAMRQTAWHVHLPTLEVRSWVLATLTPILPDDVWL
jgi:hypothetical protein